MAMLVLPLPASGGGGISSINGQTGAAISIVGTANRITVGTAGDTLTLSCPQDIATASSPTFAGLTLTAFSGFVKATAGVLSAAALSATDITTGTLPVARGGTNSNTTLNSNRMMLSVAGAIVEGGALTDAQFFAGRTGATPAVTSILGTANQIVATFGANAITLSCPQSIATTSDVVFNSVTTAAALTVGTDVTFTNIATGTGTALVRTAMGEVVELTSTTRHKENIHSLRETINPSAILALEGKTFNYKKQSKEDICFGFLAEDVAAISKDLVIFDTNNSPYSLQYNEFVPIMLEILKDQQKEIDILKSKDVPEKESVPSVEKSPKWTAGDYAKAILTLGIVRPGK